VNINPSPCSLLTGLKFLCADLRVRCNGLFNTGDGRWFLFALLQVKLSARHQESRSEDQKFWGFYSIPRKLRKNFK
jgi:hypothetical protein